MTGHHADPILRVVSLVPSVTETLLAWGLVPVACTRFCEQPTLPAVGGTKDPDLSAIVDLAPDVVVVSDEENRREDADALVAAGIEVHACSPRTVDHVAVELARLAERVGVSPPPALLGAPVAVDPIGISAFVPIWPRPWMSVAGDTYGSSLLSSIGVANVNAGDPERYPTVDLAEVTSRRPDVVLAPSEPYAFRARHLEELSAVAPVVSVDGQDLFWWGVRTPEAQARLAGVVRAAVAQAGRRC